FYPSHYAPFASDLKDLADLEIIFFPGEPFKPFDQLMGTLPAASSSALPEKYRDLMTDQSSPIHEFYPSDFETDMNGKRFVWQGVAKLPFIDERKLLAETKKIEDTLTIIFYGSDDVKANSTGHKMPPNQKFAWEIDTNARNVTFLNPPAQKHIPEPPKGVVMPKMVLKPLDIKPLPVLWHEDHGGRRQQNRDRPHVPGAVSGSLLGEAAHRLLKNTLNIKPNGTSSGVLEQMSYRNSAGNHVVYRPRPAGPSGYEKGFFEDPNSFHGHHPRGVMDTPRFAGPHNEFQGNRLNFRAQERTLYEEQYNNLRNGMSNMAIEGAIRMRSPAVMALRMPNSGQVLNTRHQFVQNVAPPPSPPTRWISKFSAGNSGMNEKQVKKVYQVKSRVSQNSSDNGFQQ
ncbi:hypothetical protein RJ639_026489, partial [Escallonia herrerae]